MYSQELWTFIIVFIIVISVGFDKCKVIGKLVIGECHFQVNKCQMCL